MNFALLPRTVASLVVSLALLATPIAAPAAGGGVLSTPGQLERERQALELLASEPMKRATDALEQLLLADARAKTPSGRATARRAAESTAAAAAYAIVGEDPARPVLFWGANAPHRWFGMSLPRAGYGIENPDNIYRSVQVDGTSRYVIRGRMPKSGPIEQHYTVMDQNPGASKAMSIEGAEFVATLRSDALEVDEGGRFTITIDAEPAEGRPNHLQIPREGRFPLHVRDLFSDWSSQDPIALDIRREAGPDAGPIPSVAEQAERAAKRALQMGSFWVAWNERFLYSRPANEIDTPRERPGGRGLSASAHFALGHDEALVLTLDPLGARSLGVQLADPWGVAYEYVDRTSSLNAAQSIANTDGTYTFVLATDDPGVHNWLDPEGQDAGILVLRWQVLPGEFDLAKAIRMARVVPRAKLAEALSAATRFVTPTERMRQRAERALAYARRLDR